MSNKMMTFTAINCALETILDASLNFLNCQRDTRWPKLFSSSYQNHSKYVVYTQALDVWTDFFYFIIIFLFSFSHVL